MEAPNIHSAKALTAGPLKCRILVVDSDPSTFDDFCKVLSPQGVDTDLFVLEKILPKRKKTQLKTKTENSKTLLNTLHYELNYANQGKKAIELVKTQLDRPFALMFIEMNVPPSVDSIEAVAEILKIDPRIQIVLCIAQSDYSWTDVLKSLGEIDNILILKKPFQMIEVKQFAFSLTKKWQLNCAVEDQMKNLELMVKERTIQLERLLALTKATLESTTDGILVVDKQHRIINYNKKFVDMWQIPENLLQLQTDHAVFQHIITRMKNSEKFILKQEYLADHPEEESFDEIELNNHQTYERYSIPYFISDKIFGRVWSFRNITERKEMQENLRYQATYDLLTKLPNRTLLYDRLRQAIALAKRFDTILAVFFCDLDRFKLINDGLGHATGDLLLKNIAERIKKNLRSTDTVARFGGDEFVILLSGLKSSDQAVLMANKILRLISTPMMINKQKLSITTSIGVALCPQDSDIPELLIKNADIAMYHAKERGKNTYQFYSQDMGARANKRMELENDLRLALEKNELYIEYQPIIDMHTQQIVEIEALLRWQHPVFGRIAPLEFIYIAEETGLIDAIGEWVIETACAQNYSWQQQGLKPIRMAVNVSAFQFKNQHIDDIILKILNKTGLDPKYLVLELTENAILSNIDTIDEIFKRIRKHGIQIAIDDFGTGYSGFAYLRKMSVDKIKIDKSFIQGLPNNLNDVAIVNSIITMANSLNITVLAEGIEHKQQMQYLQSKQCAQMQGTLFSWAIPAKDMTVMLQQDHITLKKE